MKTFISVAVLIVLSIFGLFYRGFVTMYAVGGELIGQVKKLRLVTPFWPVCPPYYALDVSLGVMQNGTGSMSTNDAWLTVKDTDDLPAMREAVSNASIVKVKFDTRRLYACTEEYYATGFSLTNH